MAGISCDTFSVDASGSAKVKLVGTAREFNIDASGAAKLDAGSVAAEKVLIDASGAAKVAVYSTESVTGDASGAAKITISGTPKLTDLDRSGAADVNIVTGSIEE